MKSRKRQEVSEGVDRLLTKMKSDKPRIVETVTPKEGMERILGMGQSEVAERKAQSTEDNTLPASLDEKVDIKSNYHKMDNDVSDILAPLQTTTEQSIYRRLYRLSYGFRKNTCRVGMGKLAKACNISSYNITVRKAIEGLIAKGHISILEEYGNNRGTLYRVYLPCEMSGISSATIIENSALKNSALKNSALENLDGSALENSALKNSAPAQNAMDKGSEIGALENSALKNIPNKDINKDIKELSLSDIIDSFYIAIGQTKISKSKRERAESDIKELEEERYSREDIAYAAEWATTPGNIPEKVHSFGIVKQIIGQALAYKEKQEKEAMRREAEEAEREAEEAEREAEKQEIKSLRDAMSDKDLAKLRARATKEIEDSGEYSKEFINDILIQVKENEILRRTNNGW